MASVPAGSKQGRFKDATDAVAERMADMFSHEINAVYQVGGKGGGRGRGKKAKTTKKRARRGR